MNVQVKGCRHFKDAFGRMDSMRQNGSFCDVTLVTKNLEISAHKVVLASCSEFFDKKFLKMEKSHHLNLEEIEGQALSALVNYIYTSRIEVEINQSSIQNLLTGANVLQLRNIRKECCKYLEKNLNLNTSLKILLIAQEQKYMDLLIKAEAFVDKNINEIINSQEFLDLPVDKLTQLISRDTLQVPSEEKVYEGVISWLKHDLTSRMKYLSVLMSHVRLTLISRDYLTRRLITEPLVQSDSKCKDLIINALLSENIPSTVKPKPRKPRKILVVMGGNTSDARGNFEFYNFQRKCWSKINSMPLGIGECSLAVVNRKVYVISWDDIAEYDLTNNGFCKSIPMSLSRCWHGVGVLNDCVYVVGGFSKGRGLSSVEKFDISSRKWSLMASLSTELSWVGVGVLNGLLYAVGGKTSRDASVKSVEFYDPNLNIWKRTSDLSIARYGAAVGILHNKMYVIGGYDGSKVLNSVECYSPDNQKFIQLVPLNIPRYGSTVVEYDDKLYVVGGHDGKRTLGSIEIYYPEINKWELLPTNMNIARSCHGAVILDEIIEF